VIALNVCVIYDAHKSQDVLYPFNFAYTFLVTRLEQDF
jgi:hypothetical protein